jgi:hypothetical protein
MLEWQTAAWAGAVNPVIRPTHRRSTNIVFQSSKDIAQHDTIRSRQAHLSSHGAK